MRKIEINLYRHGIEEEHKAISFMETYFPLAFAGLALLLAINLLFFIITGVAGFTHGRYERKWNAVKEEAARFTVLKKEIDSLQVQREKYMKLFGDPVDISHVLADLYGSFPKNIWVDEIKFKEGTLLVSGYAVRWQQDPLLSIDTLVKNLQQKKYFSSVFPHIGSKGSRKQDFRGVEVIKFEIEGKK